MSLLVFFISLLIVAQSVSGNHVPIIRRWRLRFVVASGWYEPWLQEGGQNRLVGSTSMDALPTNRSWQPSCSHGTYQHETITTRSRQVLMMGTWLPETCWATIRREINHKKVTSGWFFLSILYYFTFHYILWFVESEEDRIIPIKYPMYLPNCFVHIFSQERGRERESEREINSLPLQSTRFLPTGVTNRRI